MAQTHKNRIVPLLFALLCAASLVVMARSAFVGLEIDE